MDMFADEAAVARERKVCQCRVLESADTRFYSSPYDFGHVERAGVHGACSGA